MGDLDRNLQASSTVKLAGGDEQFIADVVLDNGAFKLLVKSSNEISSDLRIVQNVEQNQTLNDVTYFNIFTETGNKTVSGFHIEFSDKKVVVKLEIDGVEIFDIDCERLKDTLDWNQSPLPPVYVSWNDALRVFHFTPAFPIISSSSIVISARSKTGESKQYLSSIIQVG